MTEVSVAQTFIFVWLFVWGGFHLRTLISRLNKVIVQIYAWIISFVTTKKDNIAHHLWHREKCLVDKQEDEEQRSLKKSEKEKKMQQGVIKSLIFTPQLHRSKGSVCRHVTPWETFLSTR